MDPDNTRKLSLGVVGGDNAGPARSGCTTHFVLLGPNNTTKKNCLSCDASNFDESYASPGHNGKKIMVGVEGKAKKLFFCSVISGMCHFGPM